MTRTALLAMDMQVGHIARVPDGYLARAASALGVARAAHVPVIHVVHRLRRGHVDVHPRNAMFGSLTAGAYTEDDPGAAIHPDLAPRDEEIVVGKNRVSAFSGNNLRQLLAVRGIEDLVLAGIATGGVVLSTVLQAADLDYGITVLSDACADPDPGLHDTLTEHVFARRGAVIATAEWADGLGAPGGPRA